MPNANSVLSSVVVRTLDELCFHCAEPDPGWPADTAEAAYARVGIKGHWRGELVIGLAPGLLGELTESLLGEDALTKEDSNQALLEIANVVCGNALPEIESKDVVFALSSPAPCDEAKFKRASLAPIAEASFDGGNIVVRLFREQPAS
jgi:CheY-specific phosphatase CheX